MQQEQAIKVRSVTKTFGSTRAVDDISFDVYKGEIFAMLGPNGAGKSTTIRMILDILKPDQGSIEVLGGKLDDRRRDRIGYLPEDRGLYRKVSAIEVMTYLGTLKGLSSGESRRRSMELLERLELAEHANKKVQELSKGMQQKVQFAVTVLHQPELIIVDEPFSGLDPVNTLVIKDLIMDMRSQGTAVVMSTHQMHQVEEMADRLLMISRGRQALYGPVDDVRRQHAVHGIIVEGTGDWRTLPGVTNVEPASGRRNGVLLRLADDQTPDEVLGAIAIDPSIRVDRYEIAVPSLNDIFIMEAGERPDDVNGIDGRYMEEMTHA